MRESTARTYKVLLDWPLMETFCSLAFDSLLSLPTCFCFCFCFCLWWWWMDGWTALLLASLEIRHHKSMLIIFISQHKYCHRASGGTYVRRGGVFIISCTYLQFMYSTLFTTKPSSSPWYWCSATSMHAWSLLGHSGVGVGFINRTHCLLMNKWVLFCIHTCTSFSGLAFSSSSSTLWELCGFRKELEHNSPTSGLLNSQATIWSCLHGWAPLFSSRTGQHVSKTKVKVVSEEQYKCKLVNFSEKRFVADWTVWCNVKWCPVMSVSRQGS